MAKLAAMTAREDPHAVDDHHAPDLPGHHAPDVHGGVVQSELDAHGDDAVGHDSHGHEAHAHAEHGGGDDAWVVPPLVVGLVIGIIVVVILGLGSGASPVG